MVEDFSSLQRKIDEAKQKMDALVAEINSKKEEKQKIEADLRAKEQQIRELQNSREVKDIQQVSNLQRESQSLREKLQRINYDLPRLEVQRTQIIGQLPAWQKTFEDIKRMR